MEEVKFSPDFQSYEANYEAETRLETERRVNRELTERLGDTDFPGRASLIDALKGPLVSEIQTDQRKEHWLTKSRDALLRGVHLFKQYVLKRITGDPVFLYRAWFELRSDVEAKIREIEASLGSNRNSERARLAIRLYRKLCKLYGGEANLRAIWRKVRWYTGKSVDPKERAKGHKNAELETVFGAFYHIFGEPESLECEAFACFETEEEAYLAEKAAILLPYDHDDEFPTSRSSEDKNGEEGRLCRFVLNAAAGGGGKRGDRNLSPANLRSPEERQLFPGPKEKQGGQAPRPGGRRSTGNDKPTVAIKLARVVPTTGPGNKNTWDLTAKGPYSDSNPGYWPGRAFEDALPEEGQREFHVFPTAQMAANHVQGRELLEQNKFAIQDILFCRYGDSARGYTRPGVRRVPVTCTEQLRKKDMTYWTYARPHYKTVAEYLLRGGPEVFRYDSDGKLIGDAPPGATAGAGAAP